jgi:hypothetical protein
VHRAEGVNPPTWSSTAKGVLLARPFSMKNAAAQTDGQGDDAGSSR